MAKEDYLDDLHLRIARVTDDLRTIQRELNCAAMQAPSDPELMEALNALSETEPIETLRSSLDQMRHFLWFYTQVMSNEPELGDKLRQATPAKMASDESPNVEGSFLDKLSRADEAMMLQYLADAKQRKPNLSSSARACSPIVIRKKARNLWHLHSLRPRSGQALSPASSRGDPPP